MNCQEVQKHLSEFVDENLDVDRSQRVSDHLAACALCNGEMASLAECRKLVSGLPEVEPPMGFTNRVMTHVRNAAHRPSLWYRLFSSLRIKVPLQATAAVLIAVLAAYIYQNQPLQRESVMTVQPEKFRGKADETDKLAPTVARAPAGESKTTQVPDVAKLPAQEFKDSAQLREPRAKPGERNKEISARHPSPAAPSKNQVPSPGTVSPIPSQKNSSTTSETVSPGLEQSFPSEEIHPKRARQTVPKSEKESAARDTAFTRKSAESVERTAPSSLNAPNPATTTDVPLADHDLAIRLKQPARDDKQMGNRSASERMQAEQRSMALPEDAQNLQQAREQALQTGQPQTLWVTTARNQYPLFKKELAVLGDIELESSTPEFKAIT